MKLLKIFIAAVWALGVTLASAAYADPPSVVGRLNYLSGPVSFAPAQADEDWVAATLNRPITTGDRLWTDNNAFAEMHVGSLAVRMAPQTSMDVLNLDDRALQLRVAQGDVNLRVRRLSGNRLIEIATPSGAVVVRQPGSYRISVDGDSSIVTVRAGGQAEVFTAGSSVLVRDAEEAAISGSRPELFAAAQPDDFDRWAANRDRREDRVVSTRYVPVEMTGYEDLDQYGEWRTVADYGNVWIPSSVPTGWAPYRYGHWVWISPWGWTWVDDQPWGFAPSHYGRWVWYDHYWAWAPGRLVERPVYSPALVAFIGGANFSVSVGPAVAWVPLGYREPYIPWYSASRTYVQNVNITHVTNMTNITNATNIRYVNRTAPTGVTVVSRDNFVAARPVQQATINVPSRTLAAAPVTSGAPVSQPARTSLARSQPGSRPPAQVIAREAVVVNRPPAPAREVVRESNDDRRAPRMAASAERPPVRVIERRERVSLPVNQAPRAEARAARPAIQAPRADAPAEQPRQPQAVQQSRQQEQAREQQGERLREQKRQEEQQQKAQAQQQADQIERERKQRAGQQEQAREQQRTQQEQQRQQQAAQEQQRAREQQARQQEQQQKVQQEQQRQQQAAQEQQRQAAQTAQKAQQDQQRQAAQQQAAQQQQQAPRPEAKAAPKQEPQEPEKGKRDRSRNDNQPNKD